MIVAVVIDDWGTGGVGDGGAVTEDSGRPGHVETDFCRDIVLK